MSKETVQWIEMVRKAAAGTITLTRWCRVCGDHTKHTSTQRGTRETIRCTKCGHSEEFTTK